MTLHFYLKADGALGASGKFDPKSLMVNGILFYKDVFHLSIKPTGE